MRKAVLLIILLLTAGCIHFTWALIGAAEIARAARERELHTLAERIDKGTLQTTIAAQIVDRSLAVQVEPVGRTDRLLRGVVASLAADALGPSLLATEKLQLLLEEGRIEEGTYNPAFRVARFTTILDQGFFDTLWRSRPGPLSIALHIDEADREPFFVHLRMQNWRWKLTTIRLPDRFLDEIAQRARGAIARPR